MTRLPSPGGDNGQWGQILNDFLAVEHNADGTLKKAADIAAKYQKPVSGIPAGDLSNGVQASLVKADGSVQSVNAVFPTSGNVTLTAADIAAIPASQKGAISGIAELDSSGKLSEDQIPDSLANAAHVVQLSHYLEDPAYSNTTDALQAAVTAAQDFNRDLIIDVLGTITLDKPGARYIKIKHAKPLRVIGPGSESFTFKLSKHVFQLFSCDPEGVSGRTWPFISLEGFSVDDGVTYLDMAPSTAIAASTSVPGDYSWSAITLTGGTADFQGSVDRIWLEPGNAHVSARSKVLKCRPKSGSSTQIEISSGAAITITAGDRISGAIGSDHVLIGNRHGAELGQTSNGSPVVAHFGKVVLSDIAVTNIASYQSAGGLGVPTPSQRFGVGFNMAGAGSTFGLFKATNVRLSGGDNGFWIQGVPGSFIDRTVFEDCTHDRGVAATANYTSLNFMVGGSSWVNRVDFKGCTGRNSGDVGIEVDQAMICEIDANTLIEDAYSANYYVTNFVPPARSLSGPPTATLGTALNNSDVSTDAVTVTGLPSTIDGEGFALIDAEVVHYYIKSNGTLRFERGNNGTTTAAHSSGATITFIENARQQYTCRGHWRRSIESGNGFAAYTNSGIPFPNLAFPEGGGERYNNTAMRGEAIRISGYTARLDIGDEYKVSVAGNTSTAVSIIELDRPGATGVSGVHRVPPTRIRIGTARFSASGIATGGSMRYIRLEAGYYDIQTKGLEINNTVTGLVGNSSGIYAGNVASNVRATINMTVFNSDQADPAFCPIDLAGNTSLGRLDIEHLDLYQMSYAIGSTNANYTPWKVSDSATVFVSRVIHSSNIGNDYPRKQLQIANSAVSASTTLKAFEEVVLVDTAAAAGTVTLTLPLLAGGAVATGRRPGTGTRITVIDAGNNAATRNIVLTANASDKLSGVTAGTLTLNTNGGKTTLIGHATLGWWPI